MATCKECKSFFERAEEQGKGDCVQRAVDPRQAYYKSRPVDAEADASQCESFAKK